MNAKGTSTPIDPLHDVDLKDGKFSGTTARDLQLAFDNFKANGPAGHVCVFFHGGLVSEADGLKTAAKLIKGYTDSGAYPFFFIWKSDLLTAIQALLQPHRDNPRIVKAANQAVKRVVAKIAVALDTDRSLKGKLATAKDRKTPDRTLEQLAAYAEPFDRAWTRRGGAQLAVSINELDRFAQELLASEKGITTRHRLFSPKKLLSAGNPLARIVHRFNSGHDHGLYTTVIEELFIAAGLDELLGEPIWGEMKKFIDDSFAIGADAGGTAFLDHLCAAWQRNPQLRVTLIGHSAGAIYVQRFIEALDARLEASSPLQVEVITLAAGVSFQRMNAGLTALRRRVRALRVFGLNNKTEGSYWEVPGIYSKSLLYLVSSLCEADPDADKSLVGMQRYWKGAAPYLSADILAVTDFIDAARRVWSPTNAGAKPGYQTHATRHGGFPTEPVTNSSVCYALKQCL